MIRFALLLLITLHGLIHLIGVLRGFQLSEVKALKAEISTLGALLWLLATLLLISVAAMYFMDYSFWWIFGFAAVLLSQVLIFGHWSDARFGSIPNLILLVVALLSLGSWYFDRYASEGLREILPDDRTSIVTLYESQLNELPVPVQKWIKQSGVSECPSLIHLNQSGRMRLKPEGEWMDVQAEQWFNLEEPGFLWKASVQGKLMSFKGRDLFNRSRANMSIKLFSLIPIVNSSDKNIESGSAIRFLAEMVWFPSAAVADYVSWEALDDRTALAKLIYPEHEVEVIYHFTEDGKVASVEAERFNEQTGKPENWVVEMDNNSPVTIGRAIVPAAARVIWRLETGDFCWYELEVREFE